MRNLLFAIVLATAFGSVRSVAQVYPSHPITMIVPFAAGAGTDVTARIVSEHMSRTLGQSIVIENIAGAGGTLVIGGPQSKDIGSLNKIIDGGTCSTGRSDARLRRP